MGIHNVRYALNRSLLLHLSVLATQPMRPRIPLIERYESAIRRDPGGCWVWTRHVSSAGYPQMRVGRTGNGPVLLVHRWAYEHFVCEIPDGALVLHRCDNKRCSNPDHLYIGTQADNVRDMIERGRRERPVGRSGKLMRRQRDEIASDVDRTIHKLALDYGVSESTIYAIRRKT